MKPRVLCVMLAAGRQAMVDRAVRCFQAQTYSERVLYVLDNGSEPVNVPQGQQIKYGRTDSGKSIGYYRNLANCMAIPLECDIIAHWDSDDWSHPERLSEQVKLLQESGKQSVGYREVLFWRSADAPHAVYEDGPDTWDGAQAWLYSNPNPTYCIGSSLCYWRETWSKKPFPDVNAGEDTQWWTGIKAAAVSGLTPHLSEPRMICAIHGGNTTSKIVPTAKEWKRAIFWDTACRERMAL